jgi:Phage derived protein Gp49-like (DUF891)
MTFEAFPSKLENPQGINSLKCNKAKNQMIGNRCPQLGAGSTKSECGPKWELQSALRSEFDEAVYVLHVFEKRSQRTPKDDIYLARQRYTDLIKWRKEQRL